MTFWALALCQNLSALNISDWRKYRFIVEVIGQLSSKNRPLFVCVCVCVCVCALQSNKALFDVGFKQISHH